VLLLALAVLVTGATLAGGLALARLAGAWRADLRLVAILRDAPARPSGPDGLIAAVRALPGVAEVRYVASEAALDELRAALGSRGEGLDRLPANPVPARLEVWPAAELDAAALRALTETLARLPPVDEVQAATGWVEPLERLDRGVRLGGLGLGACLGLAALGAVATAGAAARGAGRDEVAVLRLAGVPELALALPPVLQALALAALGAALGLGLLVLGSEPGAPWAGPWLRATLGLDPLPLLPSPWLASLAGGAAALALAGALAAGRP
jgi:cell division protein FtsX